MYLSEIRSKETWKKLLELQLSVPASEILKEFEKTITDTSKVKLFSGENESSIKISVSLDTPLIVIADFGYRYLDYYLKDFGNNNGKDNSSEEEQHNV